MRTSLGTLPLEAPRGDAPAVAAFDFDGTLTYCDSLLPFLRFFCGRQRFWRQMLRLAPVFSAFRLGSISRDSAKQALLSATVGQTPVSRLDAAARSFATDVLPALVNPAALRRLAAHVGAGHRVLIVSASPELYLAPWASAYGVEAVIATRLDQAGGIYTGRLLGANCRGPEKVRRLAAYLPALGAQAIYAYGDSSGDRELLAAATHPVFRGFDVSRARKVAYFARAIA